MIHFLKRFRYQTGTKEYEHGMDELQYTAFFPSVRFQSYCKNGLLELNITIIVLNDHGIYIF